MKSLKDGGIAKEGRVGKRQPAPLSHGFTLIELLVVLAVAAILVTVAVPGFGRIMAENRLAAQANQLVASLNQARSEAIRRGASVTVCIGSDLADGVSVREGGDCTGDLIREGVPLAGITPSHNIGSSTTRITYQGSGLVANFASLDLPASTSTAQPPQVQFHLDGGVSQRWICVSRMGRVAVRRDQQCYPT